MCLNCKNNSTRCFVLTDAHHLKTKPEALLAVTARTCTLSLFLAYIVQHLSSYVAYCRTENSCAAHVTFFV